MHETKEANAKIVRSKKNKPFPRWFKLAIPIVSIIIIVAGTVFAIKIGQGYRPTTEGLKGTGLLAANSFPSGAEVYINDKLTSATDDTINLPPGEYKVTIKKDGYIPWEKKLKVEAELVTQTNATLFPAVPGLSPLTLSGAESITPSPNGQKIAYAVASASATAKNGLYIMDLSGGGPLPLSQGPKHIARNVNGFDFSDAELLWSPDSSQILASFSEEDGTNSTFLLEAGKLNALEAMPDVTPRLSIILSEWEEEIVQRETKQFALLPVAIQTIATQSATNVYFAPSEEKIMYTGTEYAQLPDQILPQLLAANSQPQQRNIEPNGIYVYDLKEDRNFRVGTAPEYPAELDTPPTKQLLLLSSYQQSQGDAATTSGTQVGIVTTAFNKLQAKTTSDTFKNFRIHYSSLFVSNLQWFPNSTHILIKNADKVEVMEYDAANQATLYAGPFQDNFVYPWPDGTKLIVLTNLNSAPSNPPNLYTIGLK
jgi:hypothetical protein